MRLLALTLLLAFAAPARADGNVGVGLIIGSPTGISLKFRTEEHIFDVGFGGAVLGATGLHVHADHLWSPRIVSGEASFDLRLYFGLGVRLLSHNLKGGVSDFHIGVRAPVGLAFDLTKTNVPIDVFLEAAPVLDKVFNRDRNQSHDDPDLGLNVGIGVRYYF